MERIRRAIEAMKAEVKRADGQADLERTVLQMEAEYDKLVAQLGRLRGERR